MLEIRSQLSVVPCSVNTRLASETASNVTGGLAIAVPTRPLWSIRSSHRPVWVESAVAENVWVRVHDSTSCHAGVAFVVSQTRVVIFLSRLVVQKVGE